MLSDQKRKPILHVLVGSRAHNLHTDDSDFDYRGVFIVPTTDLLSIGKNMKTTNWVEGKVDDTSWELGHFLKMATQCNPNVLDVFKGEPIDDSGEGQALQELWPHVISRRRILDAYLGYSHNQFKKLMDQEAVDTPRVWKFGVTYIRALLNGIDILNTGTFSLEVKDIRSRNILRLIREGHVSRGVIIDEAVRLQKEIHDAYGRSTIPEAPNLEVVNEYLLGMRKKHWRLF